MSHIARIGCKFLDLECLGEAAAKKNAELRIGQKTHKAWSRGTCEHAIRLLDNPNAYEIGLVRANDGQSWDAVWDATMGQSQPLIQRFGPNLEGLQNEYLAVVAEREARKQGMMVQRTVDEAQHIHLVAYR